MSKEKKKNILKSKKNIKIGKFEISLKLTIIIGIIAVVSIIGVIIFINLSKTVKPLYDSNNNPVYIKEQYKNDIYSNADIYKGQFIDVAGQVYNIKTEEDITMIQINADVENATDNTLIYYKGSLKVTEEDYIKVTGYILGTVEYENMIGGVVSAPVIVATDLEKSTYIEVVRPTIKEVIYSDKVINQRDYEIKINKIEFAEKETRIYVEASNKAKDDFSIYTYSSVVTQNGNQYDQESNYDADYRELNSELKPGVTSDGIITFPAIQQKDFVLIIEGSSDDWDIDLEEYKFNLEIK